MKQQVSPKLFFAVIALVCLVVGVILYRQATDPLYHHDPDEETARTGELLLALAGKHSIIVIEHDMVFVRQIARTVTVLHQGSLLCEGSVDQVQADERVIEVYLGRKKKAHA